MKHRIKSFIYLSLGFMITYFFFGQLFNAGAYWFPRYRFRQVYEVGIEELPASIVNRPEIWGRCASIDIMASRIFGILFGILPLLIGIYYARKQWREAYQQGEAYHRKWVHLFFFFMVFLFFVNGFFLIPHGKAAVIIDYRMEELIPTNWQEFVAWKDGRIAGGRPQILTTTGVHWHSPFASCLVFDLHDTFEVEVPLAFPLYIYERNEEGTVIGIEMDAEGNPFILGYWFYTKEGFRIYSTQTWMQLSYDPTFEVDVMKVILRGSYNVVNLEMYGLLTAFMYHSKAQWVEEYGYYGELTDPYSIQDDLEQHLLYGALLTYLLDLKIPALITMQDPMLSDEELIQEVMELLLLRPFFAIDSINNFAVGTIPSFGQWLIEELDLTTMLGIQLDSDMKADVVEEPL